MTHYNRDYKNSPAPKADAINDIKEWLGQENWDKISPDMAQVTNVQQFDFYCGMTGVSGFPIIAWYDLYHGEGAYNKAWAELEAKEKAESL